MNEAMLILASSTFDASAQYTLRRMRGGAISARRGIDAVELHRRASTARSKSIATLIADVLAPVSASLRRMRESYRAYRIARETIAVLRGLDDRTLRDLGYDRSEIESVAIEVSIARAR